MPSSYSRINWHINHQGVALLQRLPQVKDHVASGAGAGGGVGRGGAVGETVPACPALGVLIPVALTCLARFAQGTVQEGDHLSPGHLPLGGEGGGGGAVHRADAVGFQDLHVFRVSEVVEMYVNMISVGLNECFDCGGIGLVE